MVASLLAPPSAHSVSKPITYSTKHLGHVHDRIAAALNRSARASLSEARIHQSEEVLHAWTQPIDYDAEHPGVLYRE